MFEKLLIANRGEIACRVIRTARALGYRTVAVYSDADAAAPHVTLADEAVRLGPAPAAESYLRTDAILAAARARGADALHPGYGFLSENAAFAQACGDAGLVFVGPPAEAIRAMGDKAGAKTRMIAAGVPTAPGYLGAEQDPAHLARAAAELGFPLLVKAVAGGGGRGMRLVREPGELAAAIEGARREAVSAFGDGTLMLERLIEHGRHIEIQVFADAHGQAVYLGERDCTAQRRRQKVIEEAPSPIVSPELRARMGRDAVAAALAVGYRGAGTVEFIVDAHLGYYFLEMNTRLQVEHPVTELVTGHDLVEWQLRVAAGEPLPVTQAQLDHAGLTGHAIEARLYAEDPYAGFAPQTGRIAWWRPQRAAFPGVRVDDGIVEGGEITPYYDAMVAKLIVHGRDRADAIRRLIALVEDAPLLGVRTNARFVRDLVDSPEFRDAALTTTRLDEWAAAGAAIVTRPVPSPGSWALAAACLATRAGTPAWRSASAAEFDLSLSHEGEARTTRIRGSSDGALVVATPDGAAHALEILAWDDGELRYRQDGVQRRGVAVWVDDALHLVDAAAVHVFREVSAYPRRERAADPRRVLAPVAGKLVQLLVGVGAEVAAGQQLACVEAMKFEMWLTAQAAGRVTAVHVVAGEQVAAACLLLELELTED